MSGSEKIDGLKKLREPFPQRLISRLPKPTKDQTEAVKANFKTGIRCLECGGWHHPNVVHLDYVGHAALTDRLLDCDTEWNWSPVRVDACGAPALDENGGMWITLTVCGVSRLGYGHPDGKKGGDAIKETIGDAMRNAAMRFGAALDLWHKGDLHEDESDGEVESKMTSHCPENTFNAIFPGLSKKIQSGSKTLQEVLAHIESKNLTLTKEQLERFENIKKEENKDE